MRNDSDNVLLQCVVDVIPACLHPFVEQRLKTWGKPTTELGPCDFWHHVLLLTHPAVLYKA